MTRDPLRWLTDPGADPRLTELLASSEPPLGLPDAVLARIGANLAQAAGQVASTGAAATSAGAAAQAGAAAHAGAIGAQSGIFGIAATKSLLVVGLSVLGAVGAAGAYSWSPSRHVEGPNSSSVAVDKRTQAASSPITPTQQQGLAHGESIAAQAAADVTELPLVDSAKPGAAAKLLKAAPITARAEAPNLAEEARMLERVRSVMTTDLGAARRALAEYDAKFPSGALRQERALLSVKLAALAGNRAEAEDRAAQIENSVKPSPYAKKAREVANSVERNSSSRTSAE